MTDDLLMMLAVLAAFAVAGGVGLLGAIVQLVKQEFQERDQ